MQQFMGRSIRSTITKAVSKFCESSEFSQLFDIESNDNDFAKSFQLITSSVDMYQKLLKSDRLFYAVNRYMKIQKYRHCLVESVLAKHTINSTMYAEPQIFQSRILYSTFECANHNILMTFNILAGKFDLIEYSESDLIEHLTNQFKSIEQNVSLMACLN
jgi:hypothetical protein